MLFCEIDRLWLYFVNNATKFLTSSAISNRCIKRLMGNVDIEENSHSADLCRARGRNRVRFKVSLHAPTGTLLGTEVEFNAKLEQLKNNREIAGIMR